MMEADGSQADWKPARHVLSALDEAGAQFSRTRLLGLAAIAVAALLVFGAVFLFNASLKQFRGSSAWVDHSEQVLAAVTGVQEALFDASAATTLFLQHPDQAMVMRFDAASHAATAGLARLRSLVSDNPEQTRRAANLAPLIAQRLSNLEELRKARSDFSLADSQYQSRVQTASELDKGFLQFRAAERRLLSERRQKVDEDSAQLVRLATIMAFLSLGLALAGLWLLQREKARASAREAQLKLQHAHRLALMGEVAARLAHELNQPLAAAGNYANVILRLASQADNPLLAQTAEKTGAQIQRAGKVLHRLRDFIENRKPVRTLEEPEKIAAETCALMSSFDTDVELKTDIPPGLPPVLIDRVQIQQVIVNLLRNAIEAMRTSERRQICLSLKALPGARVQFSIADRGTGLADDVAERLFQPFTSGKKGGMGVGLSICRSIVLEHGGRIWAEPNPEGGTIFHFTLLAAPRS